VKLLLDTHAVLWWLGDDERIGTKARDLIGDPENEVLISIVSLWEIVVKQRIGKLAAEIKEILDEVERQRLTLLDITATHLLALAALPTLHRDPFDHLLIAQAMAEGAIFVSEDRRARRYAVQTVTCSDAGTH
jgi:PIN domain nuclease of toxin-antitoxin system